MVLSLVTPPDARIYAVGIGVFLVGLLALWLFWKVSKFVIKAIVTLLLLAAVAAVVGWFLQPR